MVGNRRQHTSNADKELLVSCPSNMMETWKTFSGGSMLGDDMKFDKSN
jgi:hypothetical protein